MKDKMRKASEELQRFIAYFQQKPNGVFLDYDLIESETGIEMNVAGKDKLRRAISRARRRYIMTKGVGITLDSADNSIDISNESIRKVARGIIRTVDDHEVIIERHEEYLPPEMREIIKVRHYVGLTLKTHIESTKLSEDKRTIKRIKSSLPKLPDGI